MKRFILSVYLTLLCVCGTSQTAIRWDLEKQIDKTSSVNTYKTAAPCVPGTSNLSCNSSAGFNITATGFVGNNPTSGSGGCNPCCYAGADLDCDGLQDVPFSVENSKWFVYCNNTTAAITIT